MFSIGQYVSCGNKGVCTIENVTTLDISGVDKKKMYYILKPYYMAASTVYVPVDSSATSIRLILTREEAQELLEKISDNRRRFRLPYRRCRDSRHSHADHSE